MVNTVVEEPHRHAGIRRCGRRSLDSIPYPHVEPGRAERREVERVGSGVRELIDPRRAADPDQKPVVTPAAGELVVDADASVEQIIAIAAGERVLAAIPPHHHAAGEHSGGKHVVAGTTGEDADLDPERRVDPVRIQLGVGE